MIIASPLTSLVIDDPSTVASVLPPEPPVSPVANDAERSATSTVAVLREVARDLWGCRDLLVQITLRDIRLRYKQAVMGFAWSILTPTMIVFAGLVMRFAMASYAGLPLTTSDVAGVAVKGLAWGFFVGAIGFATGSVVANGVLVSKIYFPREVLPLSAVLAQGFDSLIGSGALVVVLLILGQRHASALLWVPLLAVLLFLFTAAAALVLSCANLFYRDVKYIVQIALTFGIFFTPVLLEPAMFGPRGARLMMLNPIAPVLEGMRLSVVSGHDLLTPLWTVTASGTHVLAWTPWYLGYSAAWSVLGLIGGLVLFHRLQYVFAEYV